MTRLRSRAAASSAIPPISARDSAGVLRVVLIPLTPQGLMIRRRRIVDLLDRVDADRRAVRRLQALRDRYGESPVVLALPTRCIAFALSSEGARHVLDWTSSRLRRQPENSRDLTTGSSLAPTAAVRATVAVPDARFPSPGG